MQKSAVQQQATKASANNAQNNSATNNAQNNSATNSAQKLYELSELVKYRGGAEGQGKLYVGLKGQVYDVSSKPEMYGVNAKYHVLTGRDASSALGKMQLEDEKLLNQSGYSHLNQEELEVLDHWVERFKNYPIVGNLKTSSKL